MDFKEFQIIMKRLNFVEDIGHYNRKFTRIYFDNGELFIGHTINRNKTKFQIEDIQSWIKYFDRL